jgi:hypothetical protein
MRGLNWYSVTQRLWQHPTTTGLRAVTRDSKKLAVRRRMQSIMGGRFIFRLVVKTARSEGVYFVYVNDLTFPIWRIGIVGIGTINGGGQVFIAEWGERWHIFVNRRVII